MSVLFGIELEGFYKIGDSYGPPPLLYPVDGFPGLVEIRTTGGSNLYNAFGSLMAEALKTPNVDFSQNCHIFSREDKAVIRRRQSVKQACDIRNLYGKAPRNLGNRTIASVQLNMSKRLRDEYRDDAGALHAARYGLLDVPGIIRALDQEFHNEIKLSGRQAGEYCIKDFFRLEYRSLPNSALKLTEAGGREFIERVTKALQEFI